MNDGHLESGLFDTFVVSDETSVEISRMRSTSATEEAPSTELLAGNVLRRLCALGGTACAQECQLAQDKLIYEPKWCADDNLGSLLETLGVEPKDVLMVGVTKDNVGYYDQIDKYASNVSVNSLGVRELPGFNAFFAKGSEQTALGARLADCGFAAIEMTAADGDLVRGFVHLTRPNLQGESALNFEVEGEPAGSFEYFLHGALEHYGANIDSVQVRLTTAIKGFNSPFHFGEKTPEDLFPGWFEQGFLNNVSNPEWRPGDTLDEGDVWEPDYQSMMEWQILRSGIASAQLATEDILDAGDLELGHASNHAGKHGKIPEGRDLYLITAR